MFKGFYIEHKSILVKLESCALSCNVTYNERYIKDLFLSKRTETGHSNLIQSTWMWAYKKYSTTNLLQNNAKLFQNSLSEPTSCTCPEKYCPKRIPNIGKYYSRSPLLAKL